MNTTDPEALASIAERAVAEVAQRDVYENHGRGWIKETYIRPIGEMPAVGTILYAAPVPNRRTTMDDLIARLEGVSKQLRVIASFGNLCDELVAQQADEVDAVLRAAQKSADDLVQIPRKDAERIARFAFNNAGHGVRSGTRDAGMRVLEQLRRSEND